MRIIIPGEPKGKQRPRFNAKTRATYTPSETVQYEKMVKILTHAAGKPIEGPVRVTIHAYYKIPESASKAEQNDMWYGVRRPEKKPDIDNVVKIIMDGMNGAAYKDDKQVVEIVAKKYYDYKPQVIVEVEPL